MKTIVGVRFKKPGKTYYFDPGNLNINKDEKVIVETTLGDELWRSYYSKQADR